MILELLGLSENTRMTELLVSIAEVSNLLTCLAVLFALAMFVVRFAGDDLFGNDSGVQKFKHIPPRVEFSKILLPFRVKLIGIKEPYRIDLELTSLMTGSMRVYWGVDINAFHQVLRAPGDWFTQAFFHGNLFGQGKCFEMGPGQRVEKMSEGKITVQKPSLNPMQLGAAPRDIYPCVVVIVCTDSALLLAIHIKDDKCTVPSQILAEYYKSGSTATLLNQIFIANTDIGENSDTESQEDSETEEYSGGSRRNQVARCVVCQQAKISRVILPCRHAVSCSSCFTRLSHCPMCRGFIQSYFLISREPDCNAQENSEGDGDSTTNNQAQNVPGGPAPPVTWRTRINNLTSRITGPVIQRNF
eukprot:TRINITY_DN13451_c0_g1_i2.p1 TRINITY_DN13451_c0_g1~~TRINITY_DN13451_c0_g1_i2.p1  ORF type:complete len:359 (+),score=55.98 TRINITY_DN13451_c0_g1_i2:183-1259(+)